MAFNDTLFQLGMDLTRSSTAQEEDFRGSARDVQVDGNSVAAMRGDASTISQKIFVDLISARRLDSARVAEKALSEAFEVAKAALTSVDVRRNAKDASLSGRVTFSGGYATLEAWPASGYLALDVVATRGLRPELLLSALMDAFSAREAMIKRGRSPMDGARYKKAIVAQPASAPRLPVAKSERARRAA